MENIINSTANASHFNVLGWLYSMLRKAASKVSLLNNKLKLVAFYNINHLKSTKINHFRQLTDFQKLKVGRAFLCLEIGIGQTVWQFLELLINIILALKRLRCEPADQVQKYLYLQACYWVYENKTQSMIFNSLM